MKLDDYFNETAHIGEDFSLSKATIVGPYPTRAFVEQILEWRPDKIVLAVDDGWPEERIDEIREACREQSAELCVQRVAPVSGAGLVHAKLYYFEFTNDTGSYTRRIMLAGSANASEQGFGGHAESFFHISLAKQDSSNKAAITRYFNAIEAGISPSMEQIYVADQAWVSLPALRMVRSEYTSGFDAWIRRGKLCHRYQSDSSFGRLILRLKKPMPQDVLVANLGTSGFSVLGETQVFTRPYVHYESAGDESGSQTWRKHYFIETDYGFWTSGECFKAMSPQFVAGKAESRDHAINQIREADESARLRWIDDFVRSVQAAVARLSDHEQRLEYFAMRPDGQLDVDYYRDSAQRKLARDRTKAVDLYFSSRFTSGFAFPPVPQLGDQFDEFATALCDNLLAKMSAGRTFSKPAQVLKARGWLRRGIDSGESLLEQLREEWTELRPILTAFHEEQ